MVICVRVIGEKVSPLVATGFFSSLETQGLLVYFKGRRAPGNLLLPNQFQKFSNSSRWLARKIYLKISGTGPVKLSSQGLFCPSNKLWNLNHDKKKSSSDFNVVINETTIAQVNETVFLGVVLDNNLTWKSRISSLAGKISKSIGNNHVKLWLTLLKSAQYTFV